MRKKSLVLTLVGVVVLSFPGATQAATKVEMAQNSNAVLWRNPGDIASRDLYYRAGGQQRAPRGTFTFVKEDLDGFNPKFVVRDQNGAEWKVKLGPEARAETAATRFLWAVGYFADEDYLVPIFRVAKMPRLRRGQKYIAPDGSMRDARLERLPGDVEKIGYWRWRKVPRTRELNGLKIMMSLVNNWDLKDSNTAIYSPRHNGAEAQQMYVVSDVGAAFGRTSFAVSAKKSHLDTYMRSKFITKVTPEYVDFRTPNRPPMLSIFVVPHFIQHITHLDRMSFNKRIPREDAKWIGQLLGRLSPRQIRSAFRAAGYSPAEIEGFSQVIENRIAQLGEL